MARDPHTPDLFEVPHPVPTLPASMDYRREMAALVAHVLKQADGDRHEIASRMTRLAGVEVTKYMLDAWSSEAREAYNMPTWAAPVLEAACESYLITQWLAQKRGAQMLIGREALTAELGRLERSREEANQRIRALKKQMGQEGA